MPLIVMRLGLGSVYAPKVLRCANVVGGRGRVPHHPRPLRWFSPSPTRVAPQQVVILEYGTLAQRVMFRANFQTSKQKICSFMCAWQ